VTSTLVDLHWLPIKQRVDYKCVATFTTYPLVMPLLTYPTSLPLSHGTNFRVNSRKLNALQLLNVSLNYFYSKQRNFHNRLCNASTSWRRTKSHHVMFVSLHFVLNINTRWAFHEIDSLESASNFFTFTHNTILSYIVVLSPLHGGYNYVHGI